MNDWLKPVVEPRESSSDPTQLLYVRSYLIMRVCIGVVGIALPFALIFGDLPLSNDQPALRDSLSAYYFSGVRDCFVSILAVVAVFLVTYKVTEKNLDNLLSIVAGFGALAVALFPTGTPNSAVANTPLQDALGESFIQAVHFAGATVFIGSLGVICYFFGVREGKRTHRPTARHSPRFWRNFHWSCSAAIAVAIAFLPISAFVFEIRITLLVCEIVSVVAFGTSWLMKGLERDILKTKATVSIPNRRT
jgi:hypothetical protein